MARCKRAFLCGLVLVGIGLLFAGCGDSGSKERKGSVAPADGSAPGATRAVVQSESLSSDAGEPAQRILVSRMRFLPEVVNIKPGESILWHFNDPDVIHSVTAFDRSFDSGLKSAGSTFTVRFDTPGTYCYQCTPHPGRDLCAQGAVPDSGALLLSGTPLQALVDALNRGGGGGHMQGKIVVGK